MFFEKKHRGLALLLLRRPTIFPKEKFKKVTAIFNIYFQGVSIFANILCAVQIL